MVHALKTESQYFNAVVCGLKTFEVRKNDRGFQVGDYLALNEIDDMTQKYTGLSALVKITYILDDERFCKDGFVIMGFTPCTISDKGRKEIERYE